MQGAKPIEWENFNYPPYLNMMHYDPSELEGDKKVIILLVVYESPYALEYEDYHNRFTVKHTKQYSAGGLRGIGT